MISLKARIENMNARLVNALVFCVGLFITIAGLFLGRIVSDYAVVCISIGTSILASSIALFISSKYLIRQTTVSEVIDKWGIIGIYRSRAQMNLSADVRLDKIEKNLDIIAFGLESLRNAVGDRILEKVRKGLEVRILTWSPDSPYLEQRDVDENRVVGHNRKTIIDMGTWIETLRRVSPDPGNIQIRYHNSLVFDMYYRLDDIIYTGPYLCARLSQQTITYEFRNNSLGFDYWKKYFDLLWDNDSFCRAIYQEISLLKKKS